MKPKAILKRVLNQINEQLVNEVIFVNVYGKKMEVDFFDGHAYIFIDEDLDTKRYSKLICVNSLLKRYLFYFNR